MIEAICALLVASGIPQETAKLLAVGMDAAVAEIKRIELGPTIIGTIQDIIQQIQDKYPGLSGVEKRILVSAAVGTLLENHGCVNPSQKAIDTVIQLAVNATLGLPEGVTIDAGSTPDASK